MFIAPAITITTIIENQEIIKDNIEFHRNAVPRHEHILEALEILKAELSLILTSEQLEAILLLFPEARIKLAVYEGCSDTEVENLIIDAVYSFITGCRSPLFKDSPSIDIDRAFDYLHSQAKEMGYLIYYEKNQTK
jgi:hypothetical protein